MKIVYPDLEQAINTHRKTVEVSGGGAVGHLDMGKLDSVLTHIQNDDYYPTLEDKLTHLFFSACKFHCFEDGNKRIAITLSVQFLLLNGYLYCVREFLREMENISYYVATDNINKDLLKEIITAIVNQDQDDESLKLKILRAISENET
ncbi:MAG: type II toxin-antitoxin system death-on-curing family toxin [Deltaproteobacteria bacterium]|jgi:death on curing protein|nr:type II toxin-antitoxin system death-on-curing family toxin [Deltaproteobacteria bacterium]MBT4639623.1 type II toxin-antitoxin system death-on-curing family toxin [Deltaproteobacteria bacterium]